MRNLKISASLLAADFAHLADSVRAAEEGGCDELHFDVMDGHFVPNITVGVPVLEAIRPLTRLPVDVHMMVEEPERFAEAFADAGADIFTIHIEACKDAPAAIEAARAAGMRPAVSIKPATPVSDIEPLLGSVDRILVMTVEPGAGGQSFMPEMLPKVREIQRISVGRGLDIEIAVDGGIKADTARQAVDAGARTLISGTGVFGHPDGIRAAVDALRAADAGD